MQTLVANLFDHETSKPVKGAVVTWYRTAARTVPGEFRKRENWAKLKDAEWKGLDTIRIGSAVTNENGQAHLMVDPQAMDQEEARRPNIWFVIEQSAVTSSNDCSAVLFVSCDIRVRPGLHEAFSVRMDATTRRQVATNFNAPVRLADNLKLDALTSTIGPSAPQRKPVAGLSINKPFSKVIAEHLGEERTARKKILGREISALSIPVTLAVRGSEEGAPPRIRFDGKQMVVSHGERDRPLSLDKVERYTNQKLTESAIGTPSVEIKESTGQFTLKLPKVPGTLELDENRPTLLFEELTRRSSN